MKLNKYIAAGILGATVMGLGSCSSDFLDEEYTTGFSTEYFKTPEGIQALTLSLYGHIRWLGGYESQGYYQTMGGTDEFGIGTDGANEMWLTYDVRMAPTFVTVNGNTGKNTDIWDELFFGINSANTIIESAEMVADEQVRKNCLAQAYFLRGYNFYFLTTQFGHTVLQTKPVKGVVRNYKLTTPKECWEQVISDFRAAYELFDGESNSLAGKPMSWTKSTAGHFLAKALLFAASERNNDWTTEDMRNAYLKEALEAANYVISTRQLEKNVTDLYGNWTGENCDIEKSDEILMVAGQDGNFGGRTAARNPGAFFNPQFSNFANTTLGGMRGCLTGGKDFQRFRPTEYTLSVFDNANDARLWKSFATVYGTAVEFDGVYDKEDATKNVAPVHIGDPSVVFIINDKDDHTYDKFKFGAKRYQTDANFVDEAGRLPEGGRKQTRDGESTFGPANTPVLNSWILYQNGQYMGDNFGNLNTNAYGAHGANMFPGVSKHTCGYLNAFAGDNGSRDIIIARLGETYLIRAEIKVRLNDYDGAKDDIDVLRRRGAWHEGENRSYYVDGVYEAAKNCSHVSGKAANPKKNEPSGLEANDGWNLGMNSYYLSNPDLDVTYASTEAEMANWTWDNLPDEDEAILSKIGVNGKFERALHFILNEHTRELVGEFTRWEHLSRTKTLESRAVKLNSDVKFFDKDKHYLRPIPQVFLDQLQNEDGTNLSDEQKAAWQNPGY